MNVNEISSGISHIEDLPISEFIKVIQNIKQYKVTEKVDGAELLFGIDDYGFYTSREVKGGKRVYNESDYDITFSSTYMRSAHRLLEQCLPQLKAAGFKTGDQVEAEVLYGELPNVVPYSPDTSYLIFLRTTEGTVDIDKLQQKLDEKRVSISLTVPVTDDGRTIYLKEETNHWQFSRAPGIIPDYKNLQCHLSDIMWEMKSYLDAQSGIALMTNCAIECIQLNKRPDWCGDAKWKYIKPLVKEARDNIRQKLNEHYIPHIKAILLDHFVTQRESAFGPLYEDGGWIEGVVLRHPKTGKMVKIVDKNKFGTVREAAWKMRNNLTEHAKSTDGNLSFMGSLYVKMATSIGHPALGTMQAKNYLRKAGTINEDRLTVLSEGIDVAAIKEYWISLFEQKQIALEEELRRYEKEIRNEATEVSLPATHQRTFETFSLSFAKIQGFMEATQAAKIPSDLITILVGKQLGDIE